MSLALNYFAAFGLVVTEVAFKALQSAVIGSVNWHWEKNVVRLKHFFGFRYWAFVGVVFPLGFPVLNFSEGVLLAVAVAVVVKLAALCLSEGYVVEAFELFSIWQS